VNHSFNYAIGQDLGDFKLADDWISVAMDTHLRSIQIDRVNKGV